MFTDQMRRTQKRGVVNIFEHLLHNSVSDGISYNDVQLKRFPTIAKMDQETEKMMKSHYKDNDG